MCGGFFAGKTDISGDKEAAIGIMVLVDTTSVVTVEPCSVSGEGYEIREGILHFGTLSAELCQDIARGIAVVCDLGGEVFFGVKLLLGSEVLDKVHGEKFSGQVGDVFYKQVGLDELGAVGGDGGCVAYAQGGGDSITGFADFVGSVTDFDPAGIDAVRRDNLFAPLKVGGGKAELFSLAVSRYDPAN